MRDRQIGLRELLEHDLLDPLLVRRVQVRVQEADRDRLDACLLQRPHSLAHLCVVELDQHVAVGDGDPLLHGQAVAALDERPRLPRQLLLEREVERLLVPRDVDDVAEAVRRDHPGVRAGMGEHDVGRDGRPVQEVVDVRECDTGLRAQRLHALDDAARRVVRRGGNLVDGDPALLLVDQDQVGERAADVDADPLHAPTSCSAGTIVCPTTSICSNLPFRYAAETSSTPSSPSSLILSRQRWTGPAMTKSSTSSPVR